MARSAAPSTTRRTLHYFWLVTRKHLGLFATLMTATLLFVALLSYGNPYVMSLVVDRVSAGSVAPDEVFAVFGPYIVALILINVAGQAASKVQDYAMYRLQIAASYDLATMSFDALSNQSMSFHSNRFGGTLVSQTTKFMSAYQLLLETITFPFLPVICSVVFTCAILAPRVPVYVAILMALLAVYAGRVLLHVQAHPAPQRAGGQRAEPAVGRAVRLGCQHPGGEDLRARGLRAGGCSTRRTARWWRATRSACGRRSRAVS